MRTSHGIYRENASCKDCGISLKSKYALRCKSCNGKFNNPMKGKFDKLNPNYKHGKTHNNKCLDCNIHINHNSKRCHTCAARYFLNQPKFKKTLRLRMLGSNNHMYGKKQSKETRRKISLKAGGNGVPYSDYSYGSGWTESLKDRIRERDNYTCRQCSITQEEHILIYGYELCVHHVDYNKNNHSESNLLSLCCQCHARTNFNREYWKGVFNVTFVLS